MSEIRGIAGMVCLCGLGEPFLNPEFPLMLKNPDLKLRKTKLITNGMLLTEENIDLLVETNAFSEIQVSLQTTNEDVYKKLQVGGDFNTVVENIKRLIANKPTRSKIIVQYLKTRINPREKKRDFVRLLGTSEFIHFVHVVGPVGGMAQQYSYDSLVPRKKHRRVCKGFFGLDLIINAYGDLLGCCWDNTRLQPYGNIFEMPLADILSGGQLKAMRVELYNKDFSRLPLCKRCHEVM
jgi:MoaA/NifB/PqqE/SkfB family radical SAM enzyme